MALPNEEQIREALTQVIDPELRRNIVELGMVRSIEVKPEGQVDVIVSLTTPGCPIRSHFENAVAEAVGALEGVTGVGVGFEGVGVAPLRGKSVHVVVIATLGLALAIRAVVVVVVVVLAGGCV